mmetsp:Transcript_33/g.119  ORF Transcript_33/g.119 Transcript_33/m.119 type:complete len:247 (-) Transcript_33:111-851(-)
MIELARLFSGGRVASTGVDSNLQLANEELNYRVASCLLAGPRRSAKTTLLFQYAYSKARDGSSVTFACKRRKIAQQFPLFDVDPSFPETKEALGRITMQYLADGAELELFLASMPAHPSLPSLLVIDDLAEFYPGPVHNRREADRFYRALALLKETLHFANSKVKGQLAVMASLTLVEDAYASLRDPRLALHWFDMLCMIYGGQDEFELTVQSVAQREDPASLVAKYSLLQDAVDLRQFNFTLDAR